MDNNLLGTAFTILEKEYTSINSDGADMTFAELARALANRGFQKTAELKDLFKRVDKHNTGSLGFPEYLALMYYFPEICRYDFILPARDADTVDRAFKFLENAYINYDVDKSRTLSREELKAFVSQNLPLISDAQFTEMCDAIFPKGSDKLTFKRFLLLLYSLLNPTGQYTTATTRSTMKERGKIAKSPDPQAGVTETFKLLEHAFRVLEEDFARFDADNNNIITLSELSEALKTKNSQQLVTVISQLEHLFRRVDLDDSGGIDFVEFLYFVYLLVENGSYKDIINDAVDSSAVKRAFVFLRRSYSQYDSDGNQRLDKDEVSRFLVECFGNVPKTFDKIFDRIKNVRRANIDFVRFMQLLYELVLSNGKYVGREIEPSSRPKLAPNDFRSPMPGSIPTVPRPPRMDKVRLKEVAKDKEIGSGGFSIVYKATLRDYVIAAKYIKGEYTEEAFEEFKVEVDFMKRLDHPNLCFLVGSVAEDNVMVILTEYCENGSLFDLLHKKRQRLNKTDLHRLALEIAQGMEYLHKLDPPIIHRDLKSLNILLDTFYHAKIADFGLSKTALIGANVFHTAGVGTPQWTAPEVLESPKYGLSADVYSYGVVLWEMTHNSIPYSGYDSVQIAMNVIKGVRPPIKATCPKEIAELMTVCWHKNPKERPTFTTIISTLQKCKAAYQ